MNTVLGCVILNYNTWSETIKCAESLIHYYSKSELIIYIVDNASSIKKTYEFTDFIEINKNVHYLEAKENCGYSAGNNIGIKQALEDKCDFIMICNSDILFVDDTIEKMLDFINLHSKCGIVGPQIYDKDNRLNPFYMLVKLDFEGKIKNMLLKVPLINLCLRNFKKKFILEFELSYPLKVFGVSGCCFLMNRSCCEFLFPLDENTFLYEEEYIIGSILEHSEFDIFILPDTKVIHAHGASTGGMSSFSYACLVNSEYYYLKQYLNCNRIQCKLMYYIRTLVYLLKCVNNQEYRKNIKHYFNTTQKI